MTFRWFEYSCFSTLPEPAKKDAWDGLWKELLQKGEKSAWRAFIAVNSWNIRFCVGQASLVQLEPFLAV